MKYKKPIKKLKDLISNLEQLEQLDENAKSKTVRGVQDNINQKIIIRRNILKILSELIDIKIVLKQ